jgi:cytochrome c-type biogenesis protein CcmH
MKATFIAIAALMSICAAAALVWPLLRDRGARRAGTISAVLFVAAAAGLYPLWSTWDWHVAPAKSVNTATPQVAAMVAKLQAHLREQPDDLKGWLMLGRSYVALERLDEAVDAYDHADRLGDGKNLDAILGFGEALSLRAGGDITPQVAQLFEEGLALAPDDPRALLYAGFAAAVRGDTELARTRWLSLKAQNPPPQVMQMIDQRIAELGPEGGSPTPAPAPAASAATATVQLRIAPNLKGRLRGDAPLFVFARTPGGTGPPLAVKRLGIDAIGTQVQLSTADSMMPGRALAPGQEVLITARVAFSGLPLPASGDLYGELTYEVGHDGVRELIIDKVTP